jgi:hypothetical protein
LLRRMVRDVHEGDKRLDRLNWLGRNWLAEYAAASVIVADNLLETLPPCPHAPKCGAR